MEAIINTNNLHEARKQIDKLKKENKKVIVQGRDIEFNRKILEIKKVNMLVLQSKEGRDKLKQRDSGLNHVLCNIAKENNIALAIDFNEFLEKGESSLENRRLSGKERAKILGRIMQNIRLAKKSKNTLKLLNKPRDLLSLGALFRILGADTKMASELTKN